MTKPMANPVFEERAKLIKKFADEGKLLLKELEACVTTATNVKEHFESSKAGNHSLLVSLNGLHVLFRIKIYLKDEKNWQGFICGHIRSLGEQKEIPVCDREFRPEPDKESGLVFDVRNNERWTREWFAENILQEVVEKLLGEEIILGLQWNNQSA
jgi:hypothetical protein